MDNKFSDLGFNTWAKIKTKMSVTEHRNAWIIYFTNQNLSLEDMKKDFVATRSHLNSYAIPELMMVTGDGLNPFMEALFEKAIVENKNLYNFFDYLIVNHSSFIERLISINSVFMLRPLPTILLKNFKQCFDIRVYFLWHLKSNILREREMGYILKQLSLYDHEVFSDALSTELVSLFFEANAKGMEVSERLLQDVKEGSSKFQYYSLFKKSIEEYYEYKLVSDELKDLCNSRFEYMNMVSFLKRICNDECFVLLVRLTTSLNSE